MGRSGVCKTVITTSVLIVSFLCVFIVPEPVKSISGSILTDTPLSGYNNVTGDIFIETGATLTINAGTTLEFRGNYGIYIAPNATLKIEGSSGNEAVLFNDTQYGWKGIFLNSSYSNAFINFTNIYNSTSGVSANNSGFLLMNHCTMIDNGYGVQGEKFDPVISDCTFDNCDIPLFFIKVNGKVKNCDFNNCLSSILWLDSMGTPKFENNIVENSGAITSADAIQLTTTNIQVKNNTINNSGGSGIALTHCSAYIHNNTITNNGRTNHKAGIYVHANAYIDSSTINDNNVSYNGNGIYLDRNPSQPSSNISCVITNNKIHHNLHSGVLLGNYSYPHFENNYVHNNTWGIEVYKASPVIDNSTVTNNNNFDWRITDYGMPTSLNTTYGTVTVTVNRPNQFLKVKWYLHVKVINCSSSLPLPNIFVDVSTMADPDYHLQHRITDVNGEANYMHLVERVIYNAATTVYSPYRISEYDLNIPRDFVKEIKNNVALPNSKTVTVSICHNQKPTPVTGISPIKTHDQTPLITWTQSTDPNGKTVKYYIKLGTTLGSGNIIPETIIFNTYYQVTTILTYDNTYYVCIKASDPDYANSTWNCSALKIKNVKPSAPTLISKPPNGSIYTDMDIDINMTDPSSDDPQEVSDYGEITKYSVTVIKNGGKMDDYDKDYVTADGVNFTIDHKDFDKKDVLVITVTPYDGHGDLWNGSSGGAHKHPGNGTPAVLTLYVNNHPPEIKQSIADITMNEDSVYFLPKKFLEIFSDPDNDTLYFDHLENENIDVEYNFITGTISLIPKPDYYTQSEAKDIIIISADDKDGGLINLTLNVTVKEVNDIPVINVEPDQQAYQDKKHHINITITDPTDPHDSGKLTVTTNHTEWLISDKITLVNVDGKQNDIALIFTPDNDDIGIYHLNITAFDEKEYNYKSIVLTINNVNDKPEMPVLVLPGNSNAKVNNIYNTTDEIEFEATANDIDFKWDDSLSYSWTSDKLVNPFGNLAKFKTKLSVEGTHRITITVTDSGGLQNKAEYEIEIICPECEDIPQTKLIYPLNGMKFPSLQPTISIELVWEPIDHDYSDFFVYDIEYWEDDPDGQARRVNDIRQTRYTLNIQVGRTYYWKVIPYLGGSSGVIGTCFSGLWDFEVELRTETPEPKVELISPLSGQTINETTVELLWESDDGDAEFYYYQIYLDENPEPTTLVKDYLTEMNFTTFELKDETTYYWDVVPYFGQFSGKSENGPFSFIIDTGFESKPEITITPDEFEIIMEPDGTQEFSYTITNTGNTKERLTIEVIPDTILEDSVSGDIEETEVILEEGDKHEVKFTLALDDLGEANYEIKLKIVSRDKDIFEQPTINIKVEKKEEPTGLGMQAAAAISIAIIVVIVLIILFLFFRRRKIQEKPEEDKVEAPQLLKTEERPSLPPGKPPDSPSVTPQPQQEEKKGEPQDVAPASPSPVTTSQPIPEKENAELK